MCVYRVSLFHSPVLFLLYRVSLCPDTRSALISRRGKTDSSLCPPRLRRVKVKSPSFFFPLLCFFVFFFFLQSGLEIATGSISDRGERTSKRNVVRSREEEIAEIAPGSFGISRDRRERERDSRETVSRSTAFRGWEKGALSELTFT